jgi:hypothetical protein
MNTTESGAIKENPRTLRLIWPQWQGAGTESIRGLFSEVPLEEARRGYAVGATVLNAVLPARRLVSDVSAVADVVGLTIAEFILRQVIRLQQVLRDFPLI